MASVIVVDGSNLCYSNDRRQPPDIRRLEVAIEQLMELGAHLVSELIVFVDANLPHIVPAEQRNTLDALIRSGQVVLSPSGVAADNLVLSRADDRNGIVISNDTFKDYSSLYHWLSQERSGRCIAGVFDTGTGRWDFLERRAGRQPARDLVQILKERVQPNVPSTEKESVESVPDRANDDRGSSELYRQRVSRQFPHSIVLLLDQSGSMGNTWDGVDTRAGRLADMVNQTLRALVIRATTPEGVRSYFRVAVVGYGGSDANGVRSMLEGSTLQAPFQWIADINDRATVVEEAVEGRRRRRPLWIEPRADGNTPMDEAFEVAATAVSESVDSYPDSFPPIVINITDGSHSGHTPLPIAESIRAMKTTDGNALVFSAHIGSGSGQVVRYPVVRPESDPVAQLMFDLTSVVPQALRESAQGLGIEIEKGGRGCLFDASPAEVMGMLNIGTVGTQAASE